MVIDLADNVSTWNIEQIQYIKKRSYNVQAMGKKVKPFVYIVLVKMFSWLFFANKKLSITSTALKLCDVMNNKMT